MRYLYFFSLALVTQISYGQTIADTSKSAISSQAGEEVVQQVISRTDSTGMCVENISWGGTAGLARIYYASGRLKENVPYANLNANQIHGLVTTWHENGQIESQQHFQQGKRQGKVELYYESGQLKRLSNYAADIELLGRCFDAAGIAVPYFPYEQPAFYPGGQMQLIKEFDKAIRLPYNVTKLLGKDDCIVYISFLIDTDGSMLYPQVDKASNIPAVDNAVLAVVQKLKLKRQFAPARRDGLVVQSRYIIPIRFRGMQ
jgi:protein TonB